MYGAEYESNVFAFNDFNENIPCALCRTIQASSVIMIPGKNTCQEYLPSGFRDHKAAFAYVRLDRNPEYNIGGMDHRVRKLFYKVLTVCGSLKCPPYINNYPLTCVVCSK